MWDFKTLCLKSVLNETEKLAFPSLGTDIINRIVVRGHKVRMHQSLILSLA